MGLFSKKKGKKPIAAPAPTGGVDPPLEQPEPSEQPSELSAEPDSLGSGVVSQGHSRASEHEETDHVLAHVSRSLMEVLNEDLVERRKRRDSEQKEGRPVERMQTLSFGQTINQAIERFDTLSMICWALDYLYWGAHQVLSGAATLVLICVCIGLLMQLFGYVRCTPHRRFQEWNAEGQQQLWTGLDDLDRQLDEIQMLFTDLVHLDVRHQQNQRRGHNSTNRGDFQRRSVEEITHHIEDYLLPLLEAELEFQPGDMICDWYAACVCTASA
jgi:hypothetical protein